MDGAYNIRINFLPFSGPLPRFRVYASLRQPDENRPHDDVFGFTLPVADDPDRRERYWVRIDPDSGFEEHWVDAADNVHLTTRALLHGLCQVVRSELEESEYILPNGGIAQAMHLNMVAHAEGQEQLTIQPYFLKEKRAFGWLTDFHFNLADGIDFSRRVQQLSLSLDSNFKRNLDYYLDRTHKINSFLERHRSLLNSIRLPGTNTPLITQDRFAQLPASTLRSKVYLFGGDEPSRSQFNGLRQHGPLTPLEGSPTVLFAFRERDRTAARTLAMALQGSHKKHRYSFPGFESLFKVPLKIDSNPIVLPDLTRTSFEKALDRVKKDRANAPTIPLFVLPDGDDNGYMEHKAIFTEEGIPTQVCTLRIANDDYALKWAVGNIALQLFCKCGGEPWKVRPTQNKTLIIGISQSHHYTYVDGKRTVDKYFAFSVLSDNSGIFQQLAVLGDSSSKEQYINDLRENLHRLLMTHASDFSQVVIHTSFRLKGEEMSAIHRTVRDATEEAGASGCRFAVVKVNHRNRFFGVNLKINSLVPYEGTVVNLGGREHLIWFEGIFPDRQTVTKAFPGPTHVAFLRISDENAAADNALLQDLVNLSGANWRGFNAKSAPVSVFYCHLVADFVREFQQRQLPLPKVQDLRPWFL